ncbi:hypothetical protein G7Y89_g13241 [Cudoniella acicularis]|uniref:2EXR domain-containing protein n=1 Tax=Cudoniella acicularis TaxID=354080 RepID=A0A8H4VYW4_9HELO|nr:hypothetical protein G7Y89_g13241 [Cudoniella acicularis]
MFTPEHYELKAFSVNQRAKTIANTIGSAIIPSKDSTTRVKKLLKGLSPLHIPTPAKAPTEFPNFKKLPPELRLVIWGLAAKEPRDIELHFRVQMDRYWLIQNSSAESLTIDFMPEGWDHIGVFENLTSHLQLHDLINPSHEQNVRILERLKKCGKSDLQVTLGFLTETESDLSPWSTDIWRYKDFDLELSGARRKFNDRIIRIFGKVETMAQLRTPVDRQAQAQNREGKRFVPFPAPYILARYHEVFARSTDAVLVTYYSSTPSRQAQNEKERAIESPPVPFPTHFPSSSSKTQIYQMAN